MQEMAFHISALMANLRGEGINNLSAAAGADVLLFILICQLERQQGADGVLSQTQGLTCNTSGQSPSDAFPPVTQSSQCTDVVTGTGALKSTSLCLGKLGGQMTWAATLVTSA